MSLKSTTLSFFSVVLLGSLVSCATPLQETVQKTSTEKHHTQQNYKVGVAQTVNVGEALIKVQDYWLESTESPVMVPNRSVSVTGPLNDVRLMAGVKYPVRGSFALEGVSYTVVGLTERPMPLQPVLLVRPDGSVHKRILLTHKDLTGYVPILSDMTVSDPSARLSSVASESVSLRKGYENFEILYTGISTNSLNLTYREFSPEGLARVAFFQNLTYDATAKNITFKKFRIAVGKATSESITFTVLQDGR